jgi:hypothetical protein
MAGGTTSGVTYFGTAAESRTGAAPAGAREKRTCHGKTSEAPTATPAPRNCRRAIGQDGPKPDVRGMLMERVCALEYEVSVRRSERRRTSGDPRTDLRCADSRITRIEQRL